MTVVATAADEQVLPPQHKQVTINVAQTFSHHRRAHLTELLTASRWLQSRFRLADRRLVLRSSRDGNARFAAALRRLCAGRRPLCACNRSLNASPLLLRHSQCCSPLTHLTLLGQIPAEREFALFASAGPSRLPGGHPGGPRAARSGNGPRRESGSPPVGPIAPCRPFRRRFSGMTVHSLKRRLAIGLCGCHAGYGVGPIGRLSHPKAGSWLRCL